MPTAIIAAHTIQGFFIAADGRSRRDDGGVLRVLRENQQKIFPIRDDHARFAFAVTGTAQFTSEGDDTDVAFDFISGTHEAANELRITPCLDALDYCNRLAQGIGESLERSVVNARQAGRRVNYPSNQGQFGDLIALLFLCGYHHDTSCGIIFRFFHRNQRLARPETIQRLAIGDWTIGGPPEVSHLLYDTNDARFTQFRSIHPARNRSFEEWSTTARDYVSACQSPAGLAVDPQLALGIGGRVHAATITAVDGFRWVPGMEPITAP
jgi:hypothetical protein